MTITPIAKFDAIKTGYAQKKGGTFVTFMINEGPDDDHKGITDLPLGEIVTLMVTQESGG